MKSLTRRLVALEARNSSDRVKPICHYARWLRVAAKIAFPDFSEIPFKDRDAQSCLIDNVIEIVRPYKTIIDAIPETEFENKVIRLDEALDALRMPNVHPSLQDIESRLKLLFLDPPEFMLRAPIIGGPWGCIIIDGVQYGGIYTREEWVAADHQKWDTIETAAKGRLDKDNPFWSLFLKYWYLLCNSEEKAELWILSRKLKAIWPK